MEQLSRVYSTTEMSPGNQKLPNLGWNWDKKNFRSIPILLSSSGYFSSQRRRSCQEMFANKVVILKLSFNGALHMLGL